MYRFCLIVLAAITFLVRFSFLDSYPFGFSGHAVVHAQLRLRLYKILFVSPWTPQGWSDLRAIALQEHHGPQSLLEALLTPIFGFGFTESRLIVTALGLGSMVLILAWATVAVNKWLGLAVGLVVGMAPYFLYFSRNGDSEHVNIYWHTFLLLLASQQVITRGRARDYAFMGLAVGVSLYVYATNQFLCLVTLPLVMVLKLAQWRVFERSSWREAMVKWLAFGSSALVIAWPILRYHFATGRLIPVRTPYASPNHEFSAVGQLIDRLSALWRELFIAGGDPWFARTGGCLRDWDLILLIPGIVTVYVLIREAHGKLHRAKADQHDVQKVMTATYSTYFFGLITIALIVLGSLPGVLSPAPTFRRVVLMAIGLDILKGAGLYGILLMFFRRLPRRVAQIAALGLVVGFTYGWSYSFFYDSHSHESNSANSMVAVVREVRKQIETGRETFILLPPDPRLIKPEEATSLINFELGYPNTLPSNLKIVDIQMLGSSAHNDVIVPIDTARKIIAGELPLPLGIQATNIRKFANRAGETFALIDFKSAVEGASS